MAHLYFLICSIVNRKINEETLATKGGTHRGYPARLDNSPRNHTPPKRPDGCHGRIWIADDVVRHGSVDQHAGRRGLLVISQTIFAGLENDRGPHTNMLGIFYASAHLRGIIRQREVFLLAGTRVRSSVKDLVKDELLFS
jgi:hypothetical protein